MYSTHTYFLNIYYLYDCHSNLDTCQYNYSNINLNVRLACISNFIICLLYIYVIKCKILSNCSSVDICV